jgi:hypothetical protein
MKKLPCAVVFRFYITVSKSALKLHYYIFIKPESLVEEGPPVPVAEPPVLHTSSLSDLVNPVLVAIFIVVNFTGKSNTLKEFFRIL